MAKLRISGAWSGVLEVELEEWSVQMLRQQIAKQLNLLSPHPELIRLIFKGKVLRDCPTHNLRQLGLNINAKILAITLPSLHQINSSREAILQEERFSRLVQLKDAAISLSKKQADASLPVENFNLNLENQIREEMDLGSMNDQLAIMMGLMLHANAKQLMWRLNYMHALEMLALVEEAFSLCKPKYIKGLKNIPVLQIDIMWCNFKLWGWIPEGGKRLAKARQGLEKTHGKESNTEYLQEGRHQELAMHLRLELLEGVVAHNNGKFEESRNALTSAHSKYLQLHVKEEALSVLMGMGYKEYDSKRALRMSNQNVESAALFLLVETKMWQKQRRDLEQKTPHGKSLDLQKLSILICNGFDRHRAAEALRRNENDIQKALDDLANPKTCRAIQRDIVLRKRTIMRRRADAQFERFISSGLSRTIADAVVQAYGTKERAIKHLFAQQFYENASTVAESIEINYFYSSLFMFKNRNSSEIRIGVKTGKKTFKDEYIQALLRGELFPEYDIDVRLEGEAINHYLSLLPLV